MWRRSRTVQKGASSERRAKNFREFQIARFTPFSRRRSHASTSRNFCTISAPFLHRFLHLRGKRTLIINHLRKKLRHAFSAQKFLTCGLARCHGSGGGWADKAQGCSRFVPMQVSAGVHGDDLTGSRISSQVDLTGKTLKKINVSAGPHRFTG